MVRQPFHLVDISPWPLIGSLGAIITTMGILFWFNGSGLFCLFIGIILVLITIFQWWRDVIREGLYSGSHTSSVSSGLRWGILLFIISEVIFFFSFFWAFFHSSLAPSLELGCCWPPIGIYTLNSFSTPLLNTGVLLGSGVTITYSHHSLQGGDHINTLKGLQYTIILGLYFTYLQYGEYLETSFTLADSVYGSIFFVATGFHGLHVLIGTQFLLVCLYRAYNYHFSSGHHFGFEAAAWYWHFVDVVWIFLYLSIYWWGS